MDTQPPRVHTPVGRCSAENRLVLHGAGVIAAVHHEPRHSIRSPHCSSEVSPPQECRPLDRQEPQVISSHCCLGPVQVKGTLLQLDRFSFPSQDDWHRVNTRPEEPQLQNHSTVHLHSRTAAPFCCLGGDSSRPLVSLIAPRATSCHRYYAPSERPSRGNRTRRCGRTDSSNVVCVPSRALCRLIIHLNEPAQASERCDGRVSRSPWLRSG